MMIIFFITFFITGLVVFYLFGDFLFDRKKKKTMVRYRLIEIRDKLINPDGKPFWKVEKHVLNLFWTEYFGVHSYEGATFYDKEEAKTWYNYYVNKKSVREIRVIAQNK